MILKKTFSKNAVIQILQYFFIITVTIVLFYGIFYLIYFAFSKDLIEYVELRFKGRVTVPVMLKDMLGVECATIFPVLIPFVIVFGYMKSKRIYVPVISAILFTPFIPFIYRIDSISSYTIGILVIYLITIIFGVALAYLFKLFLWTFKKLENKTHDTVIFLLKTVILLVMCFFIFYIIYFIFYLFYIINAVSYFYTPYSWDSPPTGPYYLFLLVIILSFLLGTNKEYLIYNIAMIIVLSLLMCRNTDQLSYDIKRLYTSETFAPDSFIYNFFLQWQYHDILLLLLTFFSSSSLFIIISEKTKNIRKKKKNN